MSDQDTPPPMDNFSSGNDVPPPVGPSGSDPSSSFVSPPPAGAVGLGQGKLGEGDEKTMGMLAHILGGVTNFLGPLIIWLIKKDESPFVNDQGKEALNFQITIAIAQLVTIVVSFILPFIGCFTSLLSLALWITGLIFGVLGGLEANKGKVYRYPFALRLVS